MTNDQDYNNLCVRIKRWRTRLKRAVTMIDKLERQKARMERKRAPDIGALYVAASNAAKAKKADGGRLSVLPASSPEVKPSSPPAQPVSKPPSPEVHTLPQESACNKPADDGLDMPDYLNRKLWAMPDPKSPEKKAERKAVEKEVREAEVTGKRRKMPLTGKEALRAINKAQSAGN